MQISHILSSSVIQVEQIQEFIDARVRSRLDTVKQQQTEYRSHNEQLLAAYTKLMHIQSELNAVQSSLPASINPLPHSEIASIPDILQDQLKQLRESLLDSTREQNRNAPNGVDQKPVE